MVLDVRIANHINQLGVMNISPYLDTWADWSELCNRLYL